jgi:hypothetical protein
MYNQNIDHKDSRQFCNEYAKSAKCPFAATAAYRIAVFSPFFHLLVKSTRFFLQVSETVPSNEKLFRVAVPDRVDCCSLDKAL